MQRHTKAQALVACINDMATGNTGQVMNYSNEPKRIFRDFLKLGTFQPEANEFSRTLATLVSRFDNDRYSMFKAGVILEQLRDAIFYTRPEYLVYRELDNRAPPCPWEAQADRLAGKVLAKLDGEFSAGRVNGSAAHALLEQVSPFIQSSSSGRLLLLELQTRALRAAHSELRR